MLHRLIQLKRATLLSGILFLAGILQSNQSSAQNIYLEWYNNGSGSNLSAYAGVGTAMLVGDIDDTNVGYAIPGKAFNLTGGLQYRLTNFISVRGEANIFQLYSETKEGVWDANGGVEIPSIKTFGADWSLNVVHNIIPQYKIDQGRVRFNAYVFAGIGQTFFVPKDSETGENLREVNRNQVAGGYAKLAMVTPFGGGIEYYPSSYISIGGEISYRPTTTDFLDDIKPLDFANQGNDGYYLANIRVRYSFGKKGNGNLSGFNYSSYLKKSKKRAKYK